jgi:hypothetical protein
MSTPPVPPDPPSPTESAKPDPLALLRSRSHIALLIIAAIIGAPVSTAAYFFLALVGKLQGWIFTGLPDGLGFHAGPWWWPIPPLLIAGLLVGLTIRYLPGRAGHSPADGFKAGVVLGPEAPLAVRLIKRDAPENSTSEERRVSMSSFRGGPVFPAAPAPEKVTRHEGRLTGRSAAR